MNTRYFIPVLIPLMIFSISLPFYAEAVVDEDWKNNTRNLYIGQWWTPYHFTLVYFDSEQFTKVNFIDRDSCLIWSSFLIPESDTKAYYFPQILGYADYEIIDEKYLFVEDSNRENGNYDLWDSKGYDYKKPYLSDECLQLQNNTGVIKK